MTGVGGILPGDERVPGADVSTNALAKQVLGNKADVAVSTADSVSSVIAYLKGIIGTLGAAGIDDVVIPLGPFGNQSVADGVDSAVRYAIYLINLAGDALGDSETTPGTFVVHRVRAGSDTEIVASSAATESTGVISAVIDFTDANWADGDLGYIEFTGITATPTGSGVTTTFPVMRRSFRVTQEEDIEAALVVIDAFHDVPTADSSDDNQMRDVVGRKTDAAATGAVSAVESLMAYLKQTITEGIARDAVLTTINGLVDSAETVGPFSYLDAGGEQDVVEEISSVRRRVTVEIDLDAMTQDGTIRVYRKVDGTTYRIYTETAFTAAGAEQAFDAQFTTNQDWRLTYQEGVDEGAARSIPFNTIIEVIE